MQLIINSTMQFIQSTVPIILTAAPSIVQNSFFLPVQAQYLSWYGLILGELLTVAYYSYTLGLR